MLMGKLNVTNKKYVVILVKIKIKEKKEDMFGKEVEKQE